MATVMTCARCGKFGPGAAVESAFDLQFICLDCDTVERAHPHYQHAAIAVFAALQRRDRSFRGIGRPMELQPIIKQRPDASYRCDQKL
jgi:hypothetical protein